MIDFTKLPVGTTVFWGNMEGKILNVNCCDDFPIRVRFKKNVDLSFTHNGRVFKGGERCLTLHPCRIPKEYQDLPVDTKVWVKDTSNCWMPRHFKKWDSQGRMVVFRFGLTSHTAGPLPLTDVFSEYTLTEP